MSQTSFFLATLLVSSPQAFSAFDKDRTGTISALDFRQVLHNFCFTLSEKQFSHLLKLQRLRGEHAIDWKHFLQKFNLLSEVRMSLASIVRGREEQWKQLGAEAALFCNIRDPCI